MRNVVVCCGSANEVETERQERTSEEKESRGARGSDNVEIERHFERL